VSKRLLAAAALTAAAFSLVPAAPAQAWNCGDGPECYVIAVACQTIPDKYRPVCELG
jgi:hypothetical protein